MAKQLRKDAWEKYVNLKKAGSKKKGSPLVSWGYITVDLDRLDTQLMKQLPGQQLKQIGNLDVTDLKTLEKKLRGKRSNEIEIYETNITGKILTCYWHISPEFVAKKGQGQVDFEGACARVIVSELEELYTSYGDTVEDVRARDKTGGFPLEHGNIGTGEALVQEKGNAAAASKKLQGLKAQKEVLSALAGVLTSISTKEYTSFLEKGIFDWVDTNFALDHEMKKSRSVTKINDLWQGAASITLGKEVASDGATPKNSRKVDNVIRKAFKAWTESPEFERGVLKHVKGLPLKDQLKAFSASKDVDQAVVDYAIANFAVVFTKTGKIDKRLKVNKELLKLAKADMAASSATSRAKGSIKTTKKRKARGGTRGARAKKHFAKTDHPLALMEMINAVLPDEVLKQMGSPALVNRTGRFRQSARVTNVLTGPRGGVQIDYTYQRNPYEVFEPGSGSPLANQYRDPRKIIGQSVREVAQELMGKKFIKVRRV